MCVLSLTACAVDAELTETTQAAADGSCPSWTCGGNSSVVDFREFHDAEQTGHEVNSAGYRIIDVRKNNEAFHMRVVDAELQLVDLTTNVVGPHGYSVVGTHITFEHVDTGKKYELRVVGVDTTPYWGGTNGAKTFTYLLEWYGPDPTTGDNTWMNICSNPGLASDEPGSMDPTHAVLFEGDRVSSKSLDVYAEERGWFNIACRGHALAKQHLTGHSKAGSRALGITTSLAQRTAHLKMLTADYCGIGQAFTVAGTDVHWGDAAGVYSTITDKDIVEARWTDAGAACVNTPRLQSSPNALGDSVFPDLGQALADAGCTLPPPCDDGRPVVLPVSFGSADIVSTNY